MPQVTIQPVTETLVPIGSPIPLEVASLDVGRKAKLRPYSRVQAFSDSVLIVGAYNRTYNFTVAVPQDFSRAEDIESLLAGLQYQMQLFTDPEGYSDYVRIQEVSPAHSGGQPYYYTVDITAVSMGFPLVPPPTPLPTPNVQADGLINSWPVFYLNGYWWIFYTNIVGGVETLYYVSLAPSAVSWSAPVLVHTPVAGVRYAAYFDGSNIHIAGQDFSAPSTVTVWYRRGIPNTIGGSAGTITWLQPEQTVYTDSPNTASPYDLYVSADSSTHPWVVFQDIAKKFQAYMSATTDGTWSTTLTHYLNQSGLAFTPEPTPLGSGAMFFITSGIAGITCNYYNGSIWTFFTNNLGGVQLGQPWQGSVNLGSGHKIFRLGYKINFPSKLQAWKVDYALQTATLIGDVPNTDTNSDLGGVVNDPTHNQIYVLYKESSPLGYHFNRWHKGSSSFDASSAPTGAYFTVGAYTAYNGKIVIPYIASGHLQTYTVITA